MRVDPMESATALPVAEPRAWRRHRDRGLPVIPLGIITIFVLIAILAPVLADPACAAVIEEARRRVAAAMGADHGVNYLRAPNWSKAMREATGGRGADLRDPGG